MSRTLTRLRRDFADPLLVRTGGGLRRTPRAEELVEPLRAALSQLSTLYQGPGFDPATAQRVFRAAIPDALAASLFAPLITAMAQEAPSCRIEIIPWPRFGEPVSANLDFAICNDMDLFPGFRAVHLFDDHDLLVVRNDRREAFSESSIAEMLSVPHVGVVTIGLALDPVDRWFSDVGLERIIGAVVPHYLQALLLVSQTEMPAILPSRLISRYSAALGITGIELPIEQEDDRHFLFYPAERDADPASKWLRELICRVVPT